IVRDEMSLFSLHILAKRNPKHFDKWMELKHKISQTQRGKKTEEEDEEGEEDGIEGEEISSSHELLEISMKSIPSVTTPLSNGLLRSPSFIFFLLRSSMYERVRFAVQQLISKGIGSVHPVMASLSPSFSLACISPTIPPKHDISVHSEIRASEFEYLRHLCEDCQMVVSELSGRYERKRIHNASSLHALHAYVHIHTTIHDECRRLNALSCLAGEKRRAIVSAKMSECVDLICLLLKGGISSPAYPLERPKEVMGKGEEDSTNQGTGEEGVVSIRKTWSSFLHPEALPSHSHPLFSPTKLWIHILRDCTLLLNSQYRYFSLHQLFILYKAFTLITLSWRSSEMLPESIIRIKKGKEVLETRDEYCNLIRLSLLRNLSGVVVQEWKLDGIDGVE
ncbi:Nucleoporin Nup85-like protein, partial [Aduncisulcus paluster]